MCFSIFDKNILAQGISGQGIYRLRSRLRRTILMLDCSILALGIWGRSILTSITLESRNLVAHLRLDKLETRSLSAGKAILSSQLSHLAGAAPPLLPQGLVTGLSVFAGDVDHDC